MTTTPTSIPEEGLGESWVELGPSPDRTTPLPFASGEEYLRLLREAQRESNQSSARVSLASSHRASPKSPPNSPNTELCLEEDLKGVYINYSNKVRNNDGELVCDDRSTDWIWDWSSRPDQIPPKDWKFVHPRRKMLSIRTARVGKVGLFSREMMYTILLTNMLSLILGTGVGVWLSRRSYLIPSIKLD